MDCDACFEMWLNQCISKCEDGWHDGMDAGIESCQDATLTCSAAVVACLAAETGIGAAACAVAGAACLEQFDDCWDAEEDVDTKFDRCVENCLESMDECCLHCN